MRRAVRSPMEIAVDRAIKQKNAPQTRYRAFHVDQHGKTRLLGEFETYSGHDARQVAFEQYRRNYDGLAVVMVKPDKEPAANPGYYARPVKPPKNMRQGLMNAVQMAINANERGDHRESLLQLVDLLDDLASNSNPYKLEGKAH